MADQNQRISDLLDTLTDASSEEIETALRIYEPADIAAVVAERALAGGGGGGGSLPAFWSVDDGTKAAILGGQVTVAPDDHSLPWLQTVSLPSDFDFDNDYTYMFQLVSTDGETQIYAFDSTGDLNLLGIADQGPSGILMSSVDFPTRTMRVYSGGDAHGVLQAFDSSIPRHIFAVTNDGAVILGANAEPSGSPLMASGSLALWFDDTPGTEKLKVYAVSADGNTALRGEVALS